MDLLRQKSHLGRALQMDPQQKDEKFKSEIDRHFGTSSCFSIVEPRSLFISRTKILSIGEGQEFEMLHFALES